MLTLIGVLWLGLCVLCVIGVIAGRRRHWLVILLSAPAILISGLTTLSLLQHPRGVVPAFWVLAPIPLIVGLLAVMRWVSRG